MKIPKNLINALGLLILLFAFALLIHPLFQRPTSIQDFTDEQNRLRFELEHNVQDDGANTSIFEI